MFLTSSKYFQSAAVWADGILISNLHKALFVSGYISAPLNFKFLLTILDISQSFYIFRQQIIIEIIETIFCTGFIIFLLFRLTKRIKITNSKLQEIGWTILGILLTAIIYFTCFYPSINKTLNLKNNGIEISGKTIQWINTNDSRMIEYSFVLNGHTYKKICDVVYNGKEIEGIICPDGKYVVICEMEDPDNSIMDFKRPTK